MEEVKMDAETLEPPGSTLEAPKRDYVSLKGAARIIGKAPSTLYKWNREGKFPPAVDISQYSKRPGAPRSVPAVRSRGSPRSAPSS